MKKYFVWIGIALVVIGAALSYFTTIAVADWIALAVGAVGLGLTITGVVEKATSKDWRLYTTVAMIVCGGIMLGVAGVTTETVTKVVSLVVSLVLIVMSVISAVNITKTTSTTTA